MATTICSLLGAAAGPASGQDASAGGNSHLLKATVELVYQCKLVADEAFIRRYAPPEGGKDHPVARCASPFFLSAPQAQDDPLQCNGIDRQFGDAGIAQDKVLGFQRRCKRLRAADKPEEAFRRTVFKIYASAYLVLQEAFFEEPEGPARQRIELLGKDIEFRSELLSIGEDFWGGTLTGVPSIPPVHLAAMTSLLGQLETLAKEMRDIEGRLDDKALKVLEISAQATGAEGDIKASLPSSDRIDLVRRQAEQRVATASAQISLLQARQKQIESEQSRLAAQIDALSASMNKDLVSAIGNYLGVPPELQQVANGGSVEAAFKSYVSARAKEFLQDDDLLKSAFGGVGESAAIYVQRVQEVRREIEGYVKQGEDAWRYVESRKEYIDDFKSVIRQPTVENLTRIGAKVLAKADSEGLRDLREGFCKIVDQQKPIRALLEQAREPGELSDRIRAGVLDGLRQLPDFSGRAAAYLKAAIAEVSPARQVTWLSDLVRRGADVRLPQEAADRLRTDLVRIVATLWPRSLIAKMPEHHRKELLKELSKRFGIGSQEELIDRIEEIGVPRLSVRVNRIALTVGDTVYPVAEWSEMAQVLEGLRSFEVEAAKVQARLESAVEKLSNAANLQAAVANEIFRQIPFSALDAEVEKLAGKIHETKKVWDGTLANLGESLGANCISPPKEGSAVGKLVEMQAGARMAVEIGNAREAAVRYEKAPPAAPGGPPAAPAPVGDGIDGAQGDEGRMEREIALRAFDAAVPGAGAALGLGIKVFQGMQETRELGRKMRELTEEAVRLTRTELQLLAVIDATRVAIAINRLDGELSEIKRAAALSQYDTLTRAGQTAGAQIQVGLAQIQRRQPLVFYLAERLRQEYDLLDRSIALWGPQGGTARDAIRRLVEENPQNIRLALDNDIHLFQWLDRSEERMRTDVDRVLAHWRQLHRLVSDVCDRVGCLPGQSRLGHVQQTAMIDVCALMAASDCRRFRDWLAQDAKVERRGADSFVAEIGFGPEDGHIPANLLNVRVVDIRLGAFARPQSSKGGLQEPLRLNSVQLLHPGVAFIRQPQGFAREAMAPSETASFEWPKPFDLEALADRWNAGGRASRRHFEGYGLVTSWRLVATRSASLSRVDRDADAGEALPPAHDRRSGVFVRFAYSYHLPPLGAEGKPAFVARDGNPQIQNQLKRPVIRVAGKARPDLRTFEIPQATLLLIGNAEAYAAARAAWIDRNWSEDQKASMDCDQPAPNKSVAGFASRVCLAELSPQEEQALVREQARSLLRSCISEISLVGGVTPTAQRREVHHIVTTRYGRIYEGAQKLAKRALGTERLPPGTQPPPVLVCGREFTTTFELCQALREPDPDDGKLLVNRCAP